MSSMDGGGNNGDGSGKPAWIASKQLLEIDNPRDAIIDFDHERILAKFLHNLGGIRPNVFVTEDEIVKETLDKPNGINADLWQAVQDCYRTVLKAEPLSSCNGSGLDNILFRAASDELHQLHETYMTQMQSIQLARAYREELCKPGGRVYETLLALHNAIAPFYDPLEISDAYHASNFGRPDDADVLVKQDSPHNAHQGSGEHFQRIEQIQRDITMRMEWFINNMSRKDINQRFGQMHPATAEALRDVAQLMCEYVESEEGQELDRIYIMNILYEAALDAIRTNNAIYEKEWDEPLKAEEFKALSLQKVQAFRDDWLDMSAGSKLSATITEEVQHKHMDEDVESKMMGIPATYSTTPLEPQPDDDLFYNPRYGRERDSYTDSDLIKEYCAKSALILGETPITYMNEKGETEIRTLESIDEGALLLEQFADGMEIFFTNPRGPMARFSPNTFNLLCSFIRTDTERVIHSIMDEQGYLNAEDLEGITDVIISGGWLRNVHKRQLILEHAHAYESMFGALHFVGNTGMPFDDYAVPQLWEVRTRTDRFLDWVQSSTTKPYSDNKERLYFKPIPDEYFQAFKHFLNETVLADKPGNFEKPEHILDFHKQVGDEVFDECDISTLRMDVPAMCRFIIGLQEYARATTEHVTSVEEFEHQLRSDLPSLLTAAIKMHEAELNNAAAHDALDGKDTSSPIQVPYLFSNGCDAQTRAIAHSTPDTKVLTMDPSADCEKAKHAMLEHDAPASAQGRSLN